MLPEDGRVQGVGVVVAWGVAVDVVGGRWDSKKAVVRVVRA